MAGIAGGGKKPTYFTVSNGEKQINAESKWNPGRSSTKKRRNKDHKARLTPRKCTHSFGHGA